MEARVWTSFGCPIDLVYWLRSEVIACTDASFTKSGACQLGNPCAKPRSRSRSSASRLWSKKRRGGEEKRRSFGHLSEVDGLVLDDKCFDFLPETALEGVELLASSLAHGCAELSSPIL